MFPTCKNSQKRVKNQKSTDKHLSFDGLIQKDIDLSDIYLVVIKNSFYCPLFKKIWTTNASIRAYAMIFDLIFCLLILEPGF